MFFDDFKVTHTKTNVLQYNEYYPFGLSTNSSWTRDNSKNNLLYNDASELNELTSFYDLAFRQYDPTIGRFLQVDPLAIITESFSPYQYARNNPALLNDPLGLTDNVMLDEAMGGGGAFESGWAPRRGLGYSMPSFGNSGPEVYNEWCGCYVDANEVVSHDPTHQNAEYRERAYQAIFDYNASQGQSSGNGGFDFFAGAEGAATLGWKNFAIEVKNVGGFDYKRGARDWRITSNSKYGGNKPKSPNNATIDRTSVSAGFGASMQKNMDIVDGVAVFTESYTVGWEAIGIQVNFDSNQNVTDVRFGIDSGVSIAVFGGVEISLQMGGIYVVE